VVVLVLVRKWDSQCSPSALLISWPASQLRQDGAGKLPCRPAGVMSLELPHTDRVYIANQRLPTQAEPARPQQSAAARATITSRLTCQALLPAPPLEGARAGAAGGASAAGAAPCWLAPVPSPEPMVMGGRMVTLMGCSSAVSRAAGAAGRAAGAEAVVSLALAGAAAGSVALLMTAARAAAAAAAVLPAASGSSMYSII
jgi:hypothetical protein